MIVTPLIAPFVIWGAVVLAGAFVAKKVFFDDNEVQDLKNDVKSSKKIAILGLQKAGKTTFLRFLQGDKNYKEYVATGMDEYEEFDIKFKEKVVTITKNYDIGGNDHFMRNYMTVLKNTDIVFFLFDVSLFFNDNEYYRDFCARVDFLKSLTKISTYFIATHPDKLEINEKELKVKISEKLNNKHYKSYVDQKLFVINLLDEERISEFVKKVFL